MKYLLSFLPLAAVLFLLGNFGPALGTSWPIPDFPLPIFSLCTENNTIPWVSWYEYSPFLYLLHFFFSPLLLKLLCISLPFTYLLSLPFYGFFCIENAQISYITNIIHTRLRCTIHFPINIFIAFVDFLLVGREGGGERREKREITKISLLSFFLPSVSPFASLFLPLLNFSAIILIFSKIILIFSYLIIFQV